MFHAPGAPEAEYSDTLELDLSTVEPSLAGPQRPQDRVPLHEAKASFADGAQGCSRPPGRAEEGRAASARRSSERARSRATGPRPRRSPRPIVDGARRSARSRNGSVVIAAITSCTNTSNPSVMVAAGLLAKKAVERGLDDQALGQGEPGARLEGRHRLPPRRRARRVPRPAPVQPGRLRLHDLHRQLGPAAAGDLRGDPRRRPGRRRRPERQPQLRGADQLRRPRQLPGLAAAGRRLRPGRDDGHRPPERPARHRPARASRSTSRTSGRPSARSRTRSASRSGPRCSRTSTPRSSRATSTGTRCRCRRATSTSGTTASTYVKNPPYFDGMTDRAAAGRDDRGRAGAGGAGRQHHDRPHLAGRLDQGRTARRAAT